MNASVVDFLDNSSVSRVLSSHDALFGVFLVLNYSFGYLAFSLIDLGFKELFGVIQKLHKHFSISHKIDIHLLLF